MKPWDEMTDDNERNAAIAEHVMGWTLLDRRAMGWGSGPPVWSTGEAPEDPRSSPTFQGFTPTCAVNHDYSVLEKVRSEWSFVKKEAFWEALSDVLLSKWYGKTWEAHDIVSLGFMENYEPGMYAKAAYLVVRQEDGQ